MSKANILNAFQFMGGTYFSNEMYAKCQFGPLWEKERNEDVFDIYYRVSHKYWPVGYVTIIFSQQIIQGHSIF